MGNDFIFNRNYNDLQELIEAVCIGCRVTKEDPSYPTVVSKCSKYFLGSMTQLDFRREIDNIKKVTAGVSSDDI